MGPYGPSRYAPGMDMQAATRGRSASRDLVDHRRRRTERLAAAERRFAAMTRILDDLVTIPGTGRRLGLDPVVGLIPGAGDLVSAVIGAWLVAESVRFRLPRIVVARMIANVAIDLVVGAIPLIGDLFDFVFKSNTLNLELFRRYASDETASTRPHKAFFAGIVLVLVGVAWLAMSALSWLLSIRIPAP